MHKKKIDFLSRFIKTERYEKLLKVLERRTDYLCLVIEDLHYSQNASTIVRHCDAFGIQKLHVIENRNRFKIKNHALRGTLKWIELNHFNEKNENSVDAIDHLRNEGYRIVATSPRPGSVTAEELDLTKGKIALFFGNERDGLSDTILNEADETLHVPMEGFVESLNISACCAIIVQQLTQRLRKSDINWVLNNKRREEILLNWLRGTIKKCVLLEAQFEKENNSTSPS